MRVLLVDDHREFMHVMDSLFENRGDEVFATTNGIEALEVVLEQEVRGTESA